MGECSVQRRPSNGGRPGDLQSAWVGCRSRGRRLGSEQPGQAFGKAFWPVSGVWVGLGRPSYVQAPVGAGVWRQQRWGPPPGGRVHCPACSLLHDTNWSAGGGAGAGQRGWTSIHRPRVEGQGRGSCVTSGQAWHPINNCDAVTRGSCRQASRLTGSQHGSGLPPVWVESGARGFWGTEVTGVKGGWKGEVCPDMGSQ